MKAAHLLHTQRGATLTTSTHRHPRPVQTPPEEGPSSSDCLQRKPVHTDVVEIWRGGREILEKDEADHVQLKSINGVGYTGDICTEEKDIYIFS